MCQNNLSRVKGQFLEFCNGLHNLVKDEKGWRFVWRYHKAYPKSLNATVTICLIWAFRSGMLVGSLGPFDYQTLWVVCLPIGEESMAIYS